MERAAARGKVVLSGRDLGGEFPIQEMVSNQGGLLQVRIDGVALLFEDRQVFLPIPCRPCRPNLIIVNSLFFIIFSSLSFSSYFGLFASLLFL